MTEEEGEEEDEEMKEEKEEVKEEENNEEAEKEERRINHGKAYLNGVTRCLQLQTLLGQQPTFQSRWNCALTMFLRQCPDTPDSACASVFQDNTKTTFKTMPFLR